MGLFGISGGGAGGGTAGAASNAAMGSAAQATSRQDQMYGPTEQFYQSLIPTKPGQLSPYAKGQYAANIRDINRQQGATTQAGLKSIGYRGMGGPSGAAASTMAGAGQQGQAERTGAYNQALQQTYGGGVQGAGGLTGLQQIYNPNQYYQTAIQGANAQSQAQQAGLAGIGSIIGGIGGGLSGIGSLAKAFGSSGGGGQ
jgi:hypothetical protein